MNNFPEQFLKYLDDSKKHISDQGISKYADINSDLTEAERIFIEEHIDKCKSCQEKLNQFFDEAVEKEKKSFEIDAALSTNNYLNFTDTENNIDGIISKEDDILYLNFIKLPQYLENGSIRLYIPGDGILIRIVSAKSNKKYKIEASENLSLRNIPKVYIDTVVNKFKVTAISKKKNYIFWYSGAGFLILIAIFLLARHSEGGNRVNLTTSSRPLYDSAINMDRNQGVQSQSSDSSNLKGEIAEKVNPTRQVKIAPEFRDNSYLENIITKNKDNGIIISPEIGDTLRKQIYFKWTPLETKTYTINIVDNKNKEIWSKELFDTRVTLFEKLNSGLYYWKILTDGKLKAIGKFFVK